MSKRFESRADYDAHCERGRCRKQDLIASYQLALEYYEPALLAQGRWPEIDTDKHNLRMKHSQKAFRRSAERIAAQDPQTNEELLNLVLAVAALDPDFKQLVAPLLEELGKSVS